MKFFVILLLVQGAPNAWSSSSVAPDANQNWGPASCAPKLIKDNSDAEVQCLADIAKTLPNQSIRQSIKQNGGVNEIKQSCVSRYNEMYSDGVLRIVAAMGYYDGPPLDSVWSYNLSISLTKSLKAPCKRGAYACGFRTDPDNSLRLIKYVKDLNGKFIPAIVDITVPVLSGSDKYNRSKPDEQKRRSDLSAKFFLEAIKRGEDVVMYAGHSRDGGGPDFYPSILTADKTETDYEWYKKNKPGLKALKAALQESVRNGTPPSVFASISCSSKLHFSKTLKTASPSTGYMLSSVSAYEPWDHIATMSLIDSVLAMRCGSDTNKAIQKSYPIYTLEGFAD
jgi:hypothetical protein